MSKSVKYIDIFGVHVSAVNIQLACEHIERWIKTRRRTYVCVAPVSTIVDCQDDLDYRNVVNCADMVTPDGMPLVWLGKLSGDRDVERTYGPDLMLTLCSISQERGYTHYLYGGTNKTCQLLEEALKKRFPRLNIIGRFSPPYRSDFIEENVGVIDEINRLGVDILWVGLGSPKQDFWIYQHRDQLNVPVILGVGAAFDFLSGVKRQAPRWMQKCGLEWFFRLCCEPKRLWKRYLMGNTKFIYLCMRSMIIKNQTIL